MENDKKPTEDELRTKKNTANKVEEPTVGYGEHYTYADYLKFEFDHMVELIRGKIFKMSPAPKLQHQKLAGNFHLQFGNYLKHKSCQVFIAPFDVVLPVPNHIRKVDSHTVVQPDLCLICDPAKLDEAGCFGVPDLVIEILSPHTSKKDLQLKYEVYEEAGVKEYWIAMPIEKLVEVFVLENNKYKRIQTFTQEDVITPQVLPELTIDLAEAFDYPKIMKPHPLRTAYKN